MSTNAKESKANAIILGYATACSVISGVLANTEVGDLPPLAVLNSAMILQLADLCGKNLTVVAAAATAGHLFAVVAGGYLAAKLFTWIPFLGNAINAGLAFGLAQVIGWTAFAMFNEGLSEQEAIKFARKKEISKDEMEKRLNRMSATDRARYKTLASQLGNSSISDCERQNISLEMADIMQSYA